MAAHKTSTVRDLEFYWPQLDHVLPRHSIPFELVIKDVCLRRDAGETPDGSDYQRRFPELAGTICKWFAGAGQTQILDEAGGPEIPALPLGAQVDDFLILKQLGKGAFANVYLARQESMQRLVALKAAARGSEELQALSQLDHAHIVRVYDQRRLTEPPAVLLYMQYLPGGTLADCVKYLRTLPAKQWNGQRLLEVIDQSLLNASQAVPEHSWVREQVAELEWSEVVAWPGIQLAEGLAYAHAKGILYRAQRLKRHSTAYLLSAAAIPLTAIALLVFRQNLPRVYVLVGAALTLLGLLAAYLAHRKLEHTLGQFSKILTKQDRNQLS